VTSTSRNEPGEGEVAQPARPTADRRWRVGTPVVVLLCGALFVVSGTNSQGTDLRPGRYTSLATLTEGAARSAQDLQAQASELESQVDDLTAQVDDARVRKEERRADRLLGPAGLEPVSGPGLTIVMSDASEATFESALSSQDVDLDLLVVHQQDLQAVVNALWAGGADAVTLQGQRIITTTGIKCSGSQVLLQGVPFPQPYTIQAVGDTAALLSALDRDQDVAAYRSDAEQPDIGIGWSLEEDERVEAPAYDGLLGVDHARPKAGSTPA
jgi:uncharacterized protein YlxW (UPF0749 family)